MSIMIDLPPAMIREAQGYATLQGVTVERMFLDCLEVELARRRQAKGVLSQLDALMRKTGAKLHGPAYKFNRADAYEPETVCA